MEGSRGDAPRGSETMRTLPLLLAILMLTTVPLAAAGAQVYVATGGATSGVCKDDVVTGQGAYTGTVEGVQDPPAPGAVYPADWSITTSYAKGADGKCNVSAVTCRLHISNGSVITQTRGGAATGQYVWLGVPIAITGGTMDCWAGGVHVTLTGENAIVIEGSAHGAFALTLA